MVVSDPGSPARVLVIDDSPPMREVMRAVIEATPGFTWVGEATDGEDGLSQALSRRPDLVLMDVRMPGIDGLEAAHRMLGARRAPVVVLMAAHGELFDRVPEGALTLSKPDLTPSALERIWELGRAQD